LHERAKQRNEFFNRDGFNHKVHIIACSVDEEVAHAAAYNENAQIL
jgi:hypothetical protein